MFKEMPTKKVPLTRALATEFATMGGWRGERALQPKRLRFLEGKLMDGLFHTPTWAVAVLNGTRRRVNGQHSSMMLAECDNGYFPEGMEVVIQEFMCEAEEDVCRLFSQFDHMYSKRSAADITGAHARIHEDLDGISPGVIVLILSGVVFAMSDGKAKRALSQEDRSNLVHNERPFIIWVKEFIGMDHMRRSPIMAVMHKTYKKDREAAKVFWSFVRDESHPDTKNSTRVLARFLRDAAVRSDHRRKTYPQRAFYVKTLHAWNAFRRNKTTQLHYQSKAGIPRII